MDKICKTCIYWHSRSGKCVSGDSRYYETVCSAHFTCHCWSDIYIHPLTGKQTTKETVSKMRRAKHLSPDEIIESQKNNIEALIKVTESKIEVIKQLREQVSQQKAMINENIAVENIYRELKEKYRNVKYMNRELLRAIREWGDE